MYQGLAYRTAYLLTGSSADAEDAAQVGFVRAWSALPRFQAGCAVQALAPAHRGERGAQPAALHRTARGARPARRRGRPLAETRSRLPRGPCSTASARASSSPRSTGSTSATGTCSSAATCSSCPRRRRAVVLDVRRGHREVADGAGARAPAGGDGAMSELERALVTLGRELAVPDAPDLASAVLARLERPARPTPRRRFVLAVAIALLAMLGAILAIPDARSAFLRVLTIGGEEIRDRRRAARGHARSGRARPRRRLGRRVSLDEARTAAGFPLRELDDEPDRVYVGDRGTVWFLYGTPDEVRPARRADAARPPSTRSSS